MKDQRLALQYNKHGKALFLRRANYIYVIFTELIIVHVHHFNCIKPTTDSTSSR